MRKYIAVLALLWFAVVPGIGLVWAACPANNPFSANSVPIQGPDPTGQNGYPLAVVSATGCPLDVTSSGGLSACVTQCTSPWTVGFGGVRQPISTDLSTDASTDPPNGSMVNAFAPVWANTGTGQYQLFRAGFMGSGALSITQPSLFVRAGVSARGISPDGTQDNTLSPITMSNFGGIGDWTNPSTVNPITVQAFDYRRGSGTNLYQTRNPDKFKTVATAALGNTALWAPAAGKKFRLMRYMVTIVDQSTQAAPGTVTVSLFDGAAGVTGQVHDVFVPALGLVNSGSLYTSGWIELGNGYLSTAANNVLNINLSAALTAGTVRVICAGTEE